MELHYRGAAYENPQSSVETGDRCMVGHYRGAEFKVCSPKTVPQPQAKFHLKYRGAWVN